MSFSVTIITSTTTVTTQQRNVGQQRRGERLASPAISQGTGVRGDPGVEEKAAGVRSARRHLGGHQQQPGRGHLGRDGMREDYTGRGSGFLAQAVQRVDVKRGLCSSRTFVSFYRTPHVRGLHTNRCIYIHTYIYINTFKHTCNMALLYIHACNMALLCLVLSLLYVLFLYLFSLAFFRSFFIVNSRWFFARQHFFLVSSSVSQQRSDETRTRSLDFEQTGGNTSD